VADRAFNKQSFSKRFAKMGDEAEAMCDIVYPRHHKLGLERPPFFMGGMPATMRQTPDRMLRDRLIECMGVGRDRKLKVKDDKLAVLEIWDQAIGPVWLFVWDSHKKRYYEAPIGEWRVRIAESGIARTFENDGKAYHELDVSNFPSDPHPIPEVAEAA
jgi:hypothetical protein